MPLENRKIGLIGATSAYLVWGFLPIFWKLFGKVSGWEVVAHRVLWSFLVLLLLLLLFSKLNKFKETYNYLLEKKKRALCLTLAAAFAGLNWWINVYGVNSNQVVELGIGMFLTPLISVFLGVLFYKEKLSSLKWLSILLALFGLIIMIVQLGRIPWIAVGVSSTWAIYGALKKKIRIDPWISNSIEAGLMLPLAVAYIYFLNHTGTSHFFSGNPEADLTGVLVATGIITTIPMIAFSYAALNLPLNVLGFCMYINPILTLLVGIFVFKESFNTEQLLPLSFIWTSIIIFLYSESIGTRSIESKKNLESADH